ncbi:glucose dehydrogenase [FAD, quinone]-like [Mytilus galloprovincialis]|uniref:glucose dehydrogenase [FAD, quinone]-like n=1 Tax=Mytilus galloprovincialis TaxID=29158 RepID=UPI003F7CA205
MIAFSSILVIFLGIILTLYFNTTRKDEVLNVHLNSTYDYIIIGAGSAGSVIANRLSEDSGVTVLLIEAGGSEYGNDNIKIPLIGGGLQKSSADWNYQTLPQKNSHFAMNEHRSYWPRGRVLGGTSCLNTLVYIRGSRHDYNQWAEEGCDGWSYKDVLPYFIKTEDYQMPNEYDSAYHGKGGYMKLTDSTLTPLVEVYRRGAEEIGYKTVDANGEDQIGFSYAQASVHNGERCSTASCYLRPILSRPNLHISIDSFVTKVIIKNKIATGVEMLKSNRKLKISAKREVIVSAGSINSPQILMLSGLGPKQHLQNLKIPVIADLPVGNNLEDHLQYFVKHKINQSYSLSSESRNMFSSLQYALTRTGPLSGTGLEANLFGRMINREESLPNYPDYQILFLSVAHDNFFYDYGLQLNLKESVKDLIKTRTSTTEFTSVLIQQRPKSTGTIRLASKDPFDYPLIQPNYLDHTYDVKSLIAGIRKIQELAASNPLQEIGATLNRQDFDGICDKAKFDSDEYWECMLRHYAVTCYHPTSTCRMGAKDDPTAVVDTKLRVRGIKGLRVADASVMRHVISGNTNAPTIMIGERAADFIRGKDTVQKFKEQIKHLKL